uniref:Protein kinase domain-containing protein n=1 Tax=viral metagenome TaxID=1070528 RepID=A0A6C0AR33_9ZZZZ
MTSIISKDDFQIIQEENNMFTVQFSDYNSEAIINSITKTRILLGTTVTDNFQTLIFKASSIKSLQQFKEEQFQRTGSHSLPPNLAAKLAADLGRQISYLSGRYNMTIIGVGSENVFVVDETKFLYLSGEYLAEIDRNNETIMVCFPVDPLAFYTAPELLIVTELPSYVNYKTCYFSFGCLLLYALMENNEFYTEYIKETDTLRHKVIMEYLNRLSIRGTKLYWFIERCLVVEPENRSIIFI